MSKENFLLRIKMTILLRLMISGIFTIVFMCLGCAYIFPAATTSIQSWWMMMAAGGMFIILFSLGTTWQWSGIISASFIVGTSAQLALTHPIWFQFIQIAPRGSFSYFLYAAITVQAMMALWVHISHGLISPAHKLVSSLSFIRTISFMILLLGVSIPAMRYIGDHNYIGLLGQTVFAGAFLLINLASLFALSRVLPGQALGDLYKHLEGSISLSNSKNSLSKIDRYFPGIVALWVFIVSSLVCIFAFERMPHIPDEIAYLFQAKYLLLGKLAVTAPAIAEAFAYDFLPMRDTMWFSIFPPGWSAVLALGVLFKLAWLVNPILGAVNIFLAHTFFKKILSRGYANIIIILIAVSPWYILMSASLMSHILTMTLMLSTWLALLKARETNNSLNAFLGGLFMGFLFLTRPLDGLVVGILSALWALGLFNKWSSWHIAASYCFGCIVIGALIFPYNSYLTGSPFLTPITHYFDEIWYPGANRLGFGLDIGPLNLWHGIDLYHGHSIWEALVNIQQNSYTMNFELFGWGIGSLSLVLVHVLWGEWTKNDFYMLAIIIATIGAYSFYWFSGSFYIGPRYWFITFLPLTVITASGLFTLMHKFRKFQTTTLSTQRLGFVLIVLCTFSMTTYLTWRGVSRYHEFRGFHTDYRNLRSEHDLGNSLIFVKTTSDSEFASAFMYNSVNLAGPAPIFARDLGPESNHDVANAFPDRSIYFIEGRSTNLSHARIILGPISRSTLQ